MLLLWNLFLPLSLSLFLFFFHPHSVVKDFLLEIPCWPGLPCQTDAFQACFHNASGFQFSFMMPQSYHKGENYFPCLLKQLHTEGEGSWTSLAAYGTDPWNCVVVILIYSSPILGYWFAILLCFSKQATDSGSGMLSQGWSPVHGLYSQELETWVKSCILINPSLTYERLKTNESVIRKPLCCQQGNTVWKFRPRNVPAERDQPMNPTPNPTETFFNEGHGLRPKGAHFRPFRN